MHTPALPKQALHCLPTTLYIVVCRRLALAALTCHHFDNHLDPSLSVLAYFLSVNIVSLLPSSLALRLAPALLAPCLHFATCAASYCTCLLAIACLCSITYHFPSPLPLPALAPARRRRPPAQTAFVVSDVDVVTLVNKSCCLLACFAPALRVFVGQAPGRRQGGPFVGPGLSGFVRPDRLRQTDSLTDLQAARPHHWPLSATVQTSSTLPCPLACAIDADSLTTTSIITLSLWLRRRRLPVAARRFIGRAYPTLRQGGFVSVHLHANKQVLSNQL